MLLLLLLLLASPISRWFSFHALRQRLCRYLCLGADEQSRLGQTALRLRELPGIGARGKKGDACLAVWRKARAVTNGTKRGSEKP